MIIFYHINLYSTSSLEKHYSISVTNNLKLRKKSWQLLDGVWSEIGYQILAQVWNSETAYISLKYTNRIARGCWGACDPNTTAYSRGRKCHDNSVWHSVTPPPWKILGTPPTYFSLKWGRNFFPKILVRCTAWTLSPKCLIFHTLFQTCKTSAWLSHTTAAKQKWLQYP